MLKWTFPHYNFLTKANAIFNSRKCSFQHDKQITVIRLCSSRTFAHTLILHKPLAFIGKTLKKYIKNSLKYQNFMKTHNYVFIQIKQVISDVCAFVVLCKLTHRFLFRIM